MTVTRIFESRKINALAFVACCLLLAAAYYFEYVEGMEPCPLCIFQRIGVFLIAIVFLLRAIHHPLLSSRWNLSYAILGLVSSILASIFAGKHVYIKSLPADQVPECGPALDYLLDVLPISQVISAVLSGDGECAKDNWTMLGISMPGWVLMFFIAVGIYMIANIYYHFHIRCRAKSKSKDESKSKPEDEKPG